MRKMKKIWIWVVLLALLAPMAAYLAPVVQADNGIKTMYVKTDNGKDLTVHAEPNRKSNSLGKLHYGDKVGVDTAYTGKKGWSMVVWGSRDGYVQTRHLTDKDPGPYHKPTKPPKTPKPTKSPEQEAEELKKKQKQLDEELESEQVVAPFYIAVRPSRSTGWVTFRVGPSTITTKVTSYAADKELIVVGETLNWYRARDPETNKLGYIQKELTVKLDKQMAVEEMDDGTLKLGKLNVNGEFELTCKLPEGYKLQVVDMRGESIIASVLPDDMTRPQMYLSIAFDEAYAEVDRMNDMTDEELAILEESFRKMNQVEIEYRETGLGTKLLVVREVGDDTDFVDFLSVYKGYFVEFVMTPNPNAAVQELTEEQIETAIQFLTDVMFEPVQK